MQAYLQYGQAGEPMRTERVDIRYNMNGSPDNSVWRVRVPGYGWRIVRYPTLRERIAGQRSPYVILTAREFLNVTLITE